MQKYITKASMRKHHSNIDTPHGSYLQQNDYNTA
ncbi:hypothetical protein BVRB_8g183090 [Beta vulgaris subsp. vulgaris]|nr:hypothetical protein BVRB_8g183090 [Beta vulgaris subsp. vulgaris]